MEQQQKNVLLNLFREERNKFRDISYEHWVTMSELICKCLANWPEVLHKYGFPIIPVPDQIKKLGEYDDKCTALGSIPPWAVLFGFILTKPRREVGIPASRQLLRNSAIPVSLLIRVLERLPEEYATELRTTVQDWWNSLSKREVNAVQLYRLGNTLMDKFYLFEETEQAYRLATELNEKITYPYIGLGYLYQVYLGQYNLAEKQYKKAIKRDNELDIPWYQLGGLYKNYLCRYSEAEVAYRKCFQRVNRKTRHILRPHSLWNFLCLFRLNEKNEQEYKRIYDIIADWIERELASPDAENVQWIDAAFLALCSFSDLDLFCSVLELLKKKDMKKSDQLWYTVLSGVIRDSSAGKFPKFSANDFFAYELENVLILTAMLNERISPKIMNQLKEWFSQALKEHSPPFHSRPVWPRAVNPALLILELEQLEEV